MMEKIANFGYYPNHIVILYDQIEPNNHRLKSSIINEIVLFIQHHRHYEKRKNNNLHQKN